MPSRTSDLSRAGGRSQAAGVELQTFREDQRSGMSVVRLYPTSDREEESPLAAERPHPLDLCEPRFRRPVVRRRREEVRRLIVQRRARVGTKELDIILREPALYLRERMTMFFGMQVLVAEPGLPSCRLGLPVPQYWIAGDEAKSRRSGQDTSEPERKARPRIVDAEHDDAARPGQWRDRRERCPWIRRVVQHTRGKDDVEATGSQAGPPQVGFHEVHAEAEAFRGGGCQRESGGCEIGADDRPVGLRQVERHLPRPAAE